MNYVKNGSATMLEASRSQSKQDTTVFTVRTQTKTSHNKIWQWQYWFLLTVRNSIWRLESVSGKSWGTKCKTGTKKIWSSSLEGQKSSETNLIFLNFDLKKKLKKI